MNLASTTLDLSSLATSQIATWDIETELIPDTGLKDIKRIFCINVKVNDQPIKRFTKLYHPTSSGNLKGALKLINSCEFNVGHNILGFDIPVVENLVGDITSYPLDTLILSQLMFTSDELYNMDRGIENMPKDLHGNFSLKCFGYRFGDYKIQFDQFDKLTDDMLTYCDQDVLLTQRLFNFLKARPNFPSERTIHLENRVASIIQQQTENGFYFDITKAKELYTKMRFEQLTIERNLQRIFKPMFLPLGPLKTTNKLIKRKQYFPSTTQLKGW